MDTYACKAVQIIANEIERGQREPKCRYETGLKGSVDRFTLFIKGECMRVLDEDLTMKVLTSHENLVRIITALASGPIW